MLIAQLEWKLSISSEPRRRQRFFLGSARRAGRLDRRLMVEEYVASEAKRLIDYSARLPHRSPFQ